MSPENRALAVAAEVARGKDALESAELLVASGKYADAVARAYYAIHHLARALLRTEDVETRTHEALRSQFGLHFVRTGRLEPRFARTLAEVQRFRELADYESTFTFTEDHASQEVRAAREFVNAAREYLHAAGY